MKLIDLSIAIEHKTVNDPPFMPTFIEYTDHVKGADIMAGAFRATKADLPKGLGWAGEEVQLSTHSGTHMDAPWHYHPTMDNGQPSRTIDQLPLEWCISDGVVLDFSDRPAGYNVTTKDFTHALDKIGYRLKPLDIVLVRSGAGAYLGSADYLAHGCGMSREATLWMLEQGVKIAGTDAWSWDRPIPYAAAEFSRTKDAALIWEGHLAGMEKEFYHMEKLTNLDKLPPHGFKVCCFPVKVDRASAAWVRAVAILS